MIIFVLCCMTAYFVAKVAEDKYPPWVNWAAGIGWGFALYGFIHAMGYVYNIMFGPQFTLLKVLSNL